MAEAGMALFAKEGAEDVEVDTAAAAAFKTEHERAIEEKSELEKSLTGKDNKKQRTAVAKGMDPPKGNFIVQKSGGRQAEASAPAEATAAAEADMKREAEVAKKAKDEKKPKKTESAGISKA